jgi:polyribonucleotide nucleotidyltransferase
VAGNETGVTSFQLDTKSEGLTLDTLRKALAQAQAARLHILAQMRNALAGPQQMKDTIPRILEFVVPEAALGKIIGPKGKTIQGLIESHGVVNINLDDSGAMEGATVQVESFDNAKNEVPITCSHSADTNPNHTRPTRYSYNDTRARQEAKAAIMQLVEDAKEGDGRRGGGRGRRDGDKDRSVEPAGPAPEPGLIYRDCLVKGVHSFGVFVQVTPGHEGLIHVSELDVKRVPDPVAAGFEAGQKLDVKLIGRNDKGQLRLSRRAVLMRDDGCKTADLHAVGERVVAVSIPIPVSAATEAAYGVVPACETGTE